MGISKFLKEAFSDEGKLEKEEERRRKFNEDFKQCCQRFQDCVPDECSPGCGKTFLIILERICRILAKFLKAYHVVSFMMFYFTAGCLFINLMTELTLEIFLTETNSHIKRLYITCTLSLLFSLAFNALYILSLFWDVMDAVMKNDGKKYTFVRLSLFVLEVVVGLVVWLCKSHSGQLYLTDLLLASYFIACLLTLLCSLYLAGWVYTKRTKFFSEKKICSTCLFAIGMIFLAIMVITAPIVYKCAETGSAAIAFSAACPLISIGFLVWTFFMGSRKSGFVVKLCVFLAMALICIAFIILYSMTNYQCGPQCQIQLPVRNTATKLRRDIRDAAQIPGYSICGKTWSKLELSITDMAFLANLAYEIDNKGNQTTIDALVDKNFLPRGIKWDVESVNLKKPSFYHIRSNDDLMVNVIGIRGTSDSRDWLENLKIWNEIAIFQLFFGFFSVNNLPETFVSTYVQVASILDRHESYVDKLEEYIKHEITNRTEEGRKEFFLVGHSLGGGLAKIVGTRLKIRSIAFSSPGEVYNHLKYGYTLQELEKYTTSFGARDDIISWIDKPRGLVQRFICDSCGFFDVHSIRNTYRNLKEKCP